MSDSPVDVAASCDSTWQKQGHSSLCGVASLPLRQFLIMKSKPCMYYSAETNSAIFKYSIVTVPFECLSTYMNYLGKHVIGPHVTFHVFQNGEFE